MKIGFYVAVFGDQPIDEMARWAADAGLSALEVDMGQRTGPDGQRCKHSTLNDDDIHIDLAAGWARWAALQAAAPMPTPSTSPPCSGLGAIGSTARAKL